MRKPIAIALTDTHLSENTIELNKSIFRQARAKTKELGLDRVQHLGDFFQSRKSQSQDVLTAFADILDEFSDEGMILDAINGNHDKTAYGEPDSFLDPFKYHPAINLYRYCGARFVNDIAIHYASFFRDQEYIALIEEALKNGSFSKQNILLTHIGCNGATMNNGTPIKSEITSALFSRFDKVFIGHYHDAQEFGNVEYIGAAIQHNFGEGTQKGLTVIYDDLSTELIPLNFPQYLTYEVDVKTVTNKDIQDLKDEKKSGDYVRVVLTGDEKSLKSFNMQSLREAGVAIQLKQEKLEIKEIETRVEAFDNQTLTEEFEAFCKKNKLNHKEGLKYFNKIVAQDVQTEESAD
jgi:exonuclease SbcD